MEPEQICQMAGQTIVNKIFLVTARNKDSAA